MKVKCEYPRCGRSFKNVHARSVHQGKAHGNTPRKVRSPLVPVPVTTSTGQSFLQPALNGELGTLATIVGLYEDLSAASQRWLRERIAVEG